MRASLIVGAGPGGTGPLVWAAQNGRLGAWLGAGVAMLDRSGSIGGTIGRYIVNSDSLGTVYLECLDAPAARDLFAPLRVEAATRELETMRYALPPLTLVGQYLHRFGSLLQKIMSHYSNSEFLPHTEVRALHLREGGTVAAEAAEPDGSISFVEARTAIVALGGRQDMAAYLGPQLMPGVRLADAELDKIMPSDALLTKEGLARASAVLDRARSRRVVILGGSHSAFSAAWVLTHLMPEIHFGAGEIFILLRRPPRIFYWTREEAQADGYTVTGRDVCPRTRRVNRLGGLRGDGRELWRRLARRPGTEPEERVAMIPLSRTHFSPASLRHLLDDAALIVPAFGYSAATLPVFDPGGRRLRLRADYGGPAVGRDARVLLADGGRLPNVFGIGLASGYRPWGHMGGELSFDGQANSLWLYQNDIGAVVFQGVCECLEAAGLLLSRGNGRLVASLSPGNRDEVKTAWPVAGTVTKPSALE